MVGSLGAAEGPAVTYNWIAQGLVAPLLPWLAILTLLALKPNRGGSAWWIWLPLACLAAGWHCASAGVGWVPRDVASVFVDVPRALAFGVAALWLLAPRLGRGGRLSRFWGMFLVLAAFGAFSFVVAGSWDEGAAARLRGLPGGGYQLAAVWAGGATQVLLLVALALVIAVAMVVNGLLCRSHHVLWLCLCFAGVLPLVMLAAAAVAYCLGQISLPVGATIAVLSLLNLLPFLVLSAANALFHDRLKTLFHPRPQEPAATRTLNL
jgi:hypothetical protein